MPENHAHGLDVSAEEERYLRRAFRRFALPYLALAAALAALSGWAAGGGSAARVEALSGELEGLRASVESLSADLDKVGKQARVAEERVVALKARKGSSEGDDLTSLESELRSVRNRMIDLEKQLERKASPDQIASLTERLGRLERVASDSPRVDPAPPAAPAPAPVPAPAGIEAR